jgi:hypothetical protein
MLLFIVLLSCLNLGLQPAAKTPRIENVAVASLDDLLNGYGDWSTHHPNVLPRDKPFNLEVPSVDLYSESGVSIYHGVDSEKNAAFLNALPQAIDQAKTGEVRPSLKEAIEMFTDFKKQESVLLADKRYTIFALTYPDWGRCKAQNDAIQKLRERAQKIGIRVLEVRLHP